MNVHKQAHLPMTATAQLEAIAALEDELGELLKVKVFDDKVRAGAQRILDMMPSPDAERDTDVRVRLLLLRCKAKLLMPFVSKEAENDLHTALKLKQGSAETWVELAECFLRRNAFKEACDALDNALRVDPASVAALCKYSQVQRNRCGESGLTPAEKTAFLEDSVAKARVAVQANVDDADAWNTMSLSLLSQATAAGMTYNGARKALAAMQQAERKSGPDPDIYFNKAVLESLCGMFGAAAIDFARAHELDSTRLKGTRRLCGNNVSVLQRAATRIRNAAGIGRGDFKRVQANLAAANAKAASTSASTAVSTRLGVVDIVTDAVMQPQALLTVDATGTFSFILMYGVSGGSFKIGDVVAFPVVKGQPVEVTHTVPALVKLGVDAVSLTIPHYYTGASSMLVNGHPVSAQSRVPLQLSSRLFA